MEFCRFCGNELVNGQCNCPAFINSLSSSGDFQYQQQGTEQQYNQQEYNQQQYNQQQYNQQEYNQQQYNQQQYVQQYEQQFAQQGYQQNIQRNSQQIKQKNVQQRNNNNQKKNRNSVNIKAKKQNYSKPYDDIKVPFLVPSYNFDFSSAGKFISSFREELGYSEKSGTVHDPYERNVPIVPDCIAMEENEIIVKQYNIAKLRTRLKFMKAEGRLMVTNRRVLFRAAGTSLVGDTLQEHQFNIDEIGGIQMHKDYKFSILNLVLCLLLQLVLYPILFGVGAYLLTKIPTNGLILMNVILGVLGIVNMLIVYKRAWLKYISGIFSVCGFAYAYIVSGNNWIWIVATFIASIILLANLIIVCFVPNLVINIKTKGASGAISIGSQKSLLFRRTGDDYSGFAEVLPWEDTVMAMNEIGTMIDDLQKQGDYAVAKWAR